MNRTNLILAGLLSLGALATVSAQEVQLKIPATQDKPLIAPPAAATPAPTFTEQQILESFGWFVGKRLGLAELEFTKEQTDAVIKGLMISATGKDEPYDMDKIGPQMDAFMQKKQEGFLTKLRNQNLGEAKAFFEKLKGNKNVVELPSGLRYEIVKPGSGAFPSPTDTVKVHYTGKLINETVFDSSVPRGEPVEFQLNKVIPGWTEGLQKVNQGGKIRLYIPPQLAYGDNGQQNIPPGATLIFDIELLDVKATPLDVKATPPAAAVPPVAPPKN
jgi:FKBP-type peptidyl-prolyl cis-trans isomerase